MNLCDVVRIAEIFLLDRYKDGGLRMVWLGRVNDGMQIINDDDIPAIGDRCVSPKSLLPGSSDEFNVSENISGMNSY